MLHVFKYLSMDDLCSVADVCSRFRQNAQTQCLYSVPYRVEKMSEQTARIIRKFGVFIKSIDVGSGYYGHSGLSLNQCCGATLTEIVIERYTLTSREMSFLQPLLPRLRKLTLKHCNMSHSFLNVMLKWSPELHVLSFISKQRGNVQYFSFVGFVIKWSPQQKEIEVTGHDDILQLGAEQALQIASIGYKIVNTHEAYSDGSWQYIDSKKMARITFKLCEVGADNVSSELFHLNVTWIDHGYSGDQFVDEILKMQKITKLVVKDVQCFTVTHIVRMCRDLSELSDLYLAEYNGKCQFSIDDLLAFVRNARKLKVLCYDGLCRKEKIHIDAITYKKMVDIVMQRPEKTHLKILLNAFTAKQRIPDEMINEHKNLLTIVITNGYMFCQPGNDLFHTK